MVRLFFLSLLTLITIHAAAFAEEIARFELEQARTALAFSGRSADAMSAGDGAADPAATPDAAPDAAPAATPDAEDRFVIRSPIDGVVLRVLQESAAVVAPGTPLLEIGDPADLELVIDVLSADAVRVRPGAEVVAEAWGGAEPLEAVVRTVEPSAFTEISALGIEEQRVNVVADLRSPPNARPSLGDGYRVEARIVTWEGRDVLQVPTGAVFRPVGGVEDAGEDRGWAVYVLEDGRARRRAVVLGHRTWRTAEVLSGLEPGERVVVHPSDRLADGVAVRVRDDR